MICVLSGSDYKKSALLHILSGYVFYIMNDNYVWLIVPQA